MQQKRRWWSRQRKSQRYFSPRKANHRGGEVDDRTFGNIWIRIWRNRDDEGQVYYTFTQHRLYERYHTTKLSRSFHTENAEDVARGAMWALREITRRETHELSPWERERRQRTSSKHRKQVESLRRKHGRPQ